MTAKGIHLLQQVEDVNSRLQPGTTVAGPTTVAR